jgi:hypothetical protein
MSYPLSVWLKLAAPGIPAKSPIDFREVHGIESPWNPALIQARILRSSMTSADPVPQATSLPEAPHPAKSEIFCKTVSGRVMVRTWAETWERGGAQVRMGLGSWRGHGLDQLGDGTWKVRGKSGCVRGRAGRGGVSSVDGAKGVGGKQHNVGLVVWSDSWRVRECAERWIREEF